MVYAPFFYNNMITIMLNADFRKVDFHIQNWRLWEEMAYTIFQVYFESSFIQYHEQKR